MCGNGLACPRSMPPAARLGAIAAASVVGMARCCHRMHPQLPLGVCSRDRSRSLSVQVGACRGVMSCRACPAALWLLLLAAWSATMAFGRQRQQCSRHDDLAAQAACGGHANLPACFIVWVATASYTPCTCRQRAMQPAVADTRQVLQLAGPRGPGCRGAFLRMLHMMPRRVMWLLCKVNAAHGCSGA
jgi:hypothetical protein